MIKTKKIALIVAFSLSTVSMSHAEDYTPDPQDPYQGYNRAIFEFNDVFYQAVNMPVNAIYTMVTPQFARDGVRNIFRNIALVPGLLNDALQWNWRYFAKDAARLALNTTVGIGGFFDVAGNVGIPWHPQGFGYTLAKWGGPDAISQPAYFVLPILGSSTIGDSVGLALDAVASPITYTSPSWLQTSMVVAYTLQENNDGIPQYQAITSTALDPYVAMREAYLQNRAYNIEQIKYDGNVPSSAQDTSPTPDDSGDISPATSNSDDMSPALATQSQ
jgi:phospholipid-binding lipoprotein MlaA